MHGRNGISAGENRTYSVSQRARKRESHLARLDYEPTGPYALDLEIFSVANLRRRFGRQLQLPHRYAFGMLLCVTRGECTQWVDFKSVRCKAGSVLVLRPGQAHRFGGEQGWDGWILLFRPEFISTPQVPEHVALRDPVNRIVLDAILRMKEDAEIAASAPDVNALLRQQFYALLLRLSIARGGTDPEPDVASNSVRRFTAFQQLVESHFAKWHQVAQYANRLGCSEKSLTRAAAQVAGVTGKTLIAARINLEAKRLLAHSTMSVTLIAEHLGFEDPTNFVKFFKREAACTPGEFRRLNRSAHLA
jgi:AraC-like DNA-binding protein/mannose-6-phosphate isomerase-like protein (cupin superfamily)